MSKIYNNNSDPFYNACRLNAYVYFLSKHQDANYELNPEFYYLCYLQGARGFFGIEVDDDLKIIRDTRFPKLYKEFCEHEKTQRDYVSVH